MHDIRYEISAEISHWLDKLLGIPPMHPGGFLPSRVDPRNVWFFSEDWQAGERRADADMQAGRFVDATTIDALVAAFQADPTSPLAQPLGPLRASPNDA